MYHWWCPLPISCIVQRDISALTTENVSVVDSLIDTEKTHNAELTLDQMSNNQRENYSELTEVSVCISGV